MPLVVITDYTFDSLDIERKVLEPFGLSVHGAQCRTQSELIDLVVAADFVITQFAPIDASVIAVMDDTKVIVRYGIGVDNIDLEAAKEKGIPVCNIPDYCVDEVADHTLGLILAATRQVVANANFVTQGNWGLAVPLHRMLCLKNLTIGIVGFGRIGREVAARLLPFKCRVQVYDPMAEMAAVQDLGCELVDLDSLLESSDLVTLHCPSNSATFHLIDANAIAKMKEGAILVNVARGSVVSTDDLLAALTSGKLSFAGLDVLESEPPAIDHPVRGMVNTIVHSHIASASAAAVAKLRTEAATIVAKAAQGEPLPSVVNGVDSHARAAIRGTTKLVN